MGHSPTPVQNPKGQERCAVVNELLQDSWTNPFTNSELVSTSTGVMVPADVTMDLIKVKDIGKTAYRIFREERLETNLLQRSSMIH